MADSSLPGYKTIAGTITERIYQGNYQPGSYLPSENELAREFKVTRTTIRKALNILKEKGTIKTFRGKVIRFSNYTGSRAFCSFTALAAI